MGSKTDNRTGWWVTRTENGDRWHAIAGGSDTTRCGRFTVYEMRLVPFAHIKRPMQCVRCRRAIDRGLRGLGLEPLS